jgi:hypothetical protein
MRKTIVLFFLMLCVILSGRFLSSQQLTGKITGKVTDQQGEPLPGVTIEAMSTRLVGKATALTDAAGSYRLLALPPGIYAIQYTLSGFVTVSRKDIVLELEKTLTMDIIMTPGKIEQEITVIGQAPLIDVRSTARGATFTREMIQNLPKGRNFDTLITTVPGVHQEDTLLGGTSIDGASGDENMYYIDGANTNSLVNGTSAQRVYFDYVEEVQFKASGYQAEYGGSMGGVVNVITRSGGNEFHGEIIGYYDGGLLEGRRRQQLDTNEINVPPAYYYSYAEYVGTDHWSRIDGGFNLGGYLIKDKVWFFGTLMPIYFKNVRDVDYGIQGKRLVKSFTRTDITWNGQFKLTTQPLKNLRVSASFINNFIKYQGDSALNNWVWAATASSSTNYSAPGFSFPNYSVAGNIDLTVGNNFLVNVRGGFFHTDQNNQLVPPLENTPRYMFNAEQPYSYLPTNNKMFPEIPAAYQHSGNWSNISANQNSLMKQAIRERINANADFTYFLNLAGEHTLKAGVQFVRQGENVDQNNGYYNPGIRLAWNMTLSQNGINYGRGKYGWYAVRNNDKTGPYGSVYNVYANQWAFYVQDSWTILNKLTINIGVRGEPEYLPSYSSDPQYASIAKAINFPLSKKISPRLGFVYDVFGDSSFKVFGSWGIFNDTMKLDLAANGYGGFKWKSAYYTLDDWDFTKIGVNGNYPGTYLYTYDFRPPNFGGTDPDIYPFGQTELSFGLEKKLLENVSASIRVVNKHVLHAIEDSGIILKNKYGLFEEKYYTSNPGSDYLKNLYKEAVAQGQLPVGVLDIPKAKREYWAVNVGLDKRFSDNWLGGVSYTWSRLTGNYSGLYSSDEIRNSPNGERDFDLWFLCYDKQLNVIDGVMPSDRTHIIKAYGSYALPFGLTLGAVVNAMSGTPVTTEWICDSAGYYPFNRGDLGRTPFLWYANAYVEYNWKIGGINCQVSANIDNVFNTDTARRIYSQRYLDSIMPSTTNAADTLYGQRTLLTKNWVPDPDAALDPLYGKERDYYPPIQVRLGLKFSF